MKKIILFIILLFPIIIKADTIYNMDIDVNLLKDGTALVREVWDVKASSGSEWYKTYKNLDNINVSNFKVYMDNKLLNEEIYWDVDGDIDDKAGSYGINRISNGLELCFGKTDHERHIFTLEYNLSNMVFNVSDAQVLYFTFIPNIKAKSFSLNMHSFYSFPDTLDVWGYGYKGYAYVKNGSIQMSNEGKLNNEYVTLLVKFPMNTFNTYNSYNQFTNFDSVLSRAEEGKFEYNYNSFNLMDFIATIFPFIITFFIIFMSAYSTLKKKYGYINNKTIDKKNTSMFREIPCNKDIFYANTLIYLNRFNYKETNIIGAIILKWVKEDKIEFINKTSGVFNKESSMIKMDINNSNYILNKYEKELYTVMYEASIDGMLETKELEKWCKNNYSKFFKILNGLVDDNVKLLKSNHHIYDRNNKNECKYKNVMDDTIYEDSKQLFGLKLFLEEFSSIDTKEVIEVKLWDEYLMFAYLFGIADKVGKQLKNLYPEVLLESNIDYDTIIFVNNISTRSVSAASSARSAAQSYSSGGGGFSSGGGGGGSFGGGGSCGGR